MGINNERMIPKLYKDRCCGCTACYVVCPVNAIFMEADEEGFLYPKVCAKTCIRCYQCVKVCGLDAMRK